MASKRRPGLGESLVAILLITRSRPGPRLVFHYPEQPDHSDRPRHQQLNSDDSDSDTDDSQSDHSATSRPASFSIVPDDARRSLKDPQKSNDSTVLGHSIESLEKILSPGRWCDGKKFEIKLNRLVYLGLPTYASENGEWMPRKANPPSKSASKDATDMNLDLDYLNLTAPQPPMRIHDFSHPPDSFESHSDLPLGTSMQTTSSTGSDPSTDGNMAMFHVVFVLRGQDASIRAASHATYHEVVTKISRALHYCQKQSDYVAAESRRMLATKTKAKHSHAKSSDIWEQLVESSELAWALKEMFHRITAGEVANLRLNGMEMSLDLSDGNDKTQVTENIGPLSAILLLDSKENLMRELSHSDASPLARFIREHTPTKSLQKVSAYIAMSFEDTIYLASHLIRWRKARLISPLHPRNTYVVAQDAPVEDLQHHIGAYHQLFPTLPTLLNMLKVLSGKPIKYGLLIPSRDHRGAYMNILSYLVCHGLVVQLKTYGWLKVPKSLPEQPKPRGEPPMRLYVARTSLLSPRIRASDEDVISVGSERTAIPPSTPVSKQSRRFSHETQGSSQAGDQNKQQQDHVTIVNPRQMSEEQRRLFDALRNSFQDPDMQEILPRLVQHLDGRHVFEEIAAKEGWKRARVEEWLADLESRGCLTALQCIR